MKFNLKERFTLYGLLPENSGSLAERRIIRNLQSILRLEKEEADEIDYRVIEDEVDGKKMFRYTWDPNKEKPVEIEITDEIKELFKEIVKQVESDKKVNDENFDLLEKISCC